MTGFALIVVYAIFGSLAVAAVVAVLWLGGQMVWTAFDSNFLSPAREIVQGLRKKR